MEKVSVIVPVYNRRNLLGRCLDSIAVQTYRPIELIIVDNGSTDGSSEFASEWSSRHNAPDFSITVTEEQQTGASSARNKGLSEATGDFTLFFDSDDTMRPDLIEKGVAEFRRNPGISLVCWKCEIHMPDGSARIPPFYPERALECHLIHSLLRTHGYMAPTGLFRSAGGWDASLPCWNDLELGMRLLLNIGDKSGYESISVLISGIPEVLVDVYQQDESITGRDFSTKAGLWEKSLTKIREDMLLSDCRQKDYLLKIIAYREMILAAHYKKENRPDLASGLLEKVLKESNLTTFQKILFNILYQYTALGGRGAWKIINCQLLITNC